MDPEKLLLTLYRTEHLSKQSIKLYQFVGGGACTCFLIIMMVLVFAPLSVQASEEPEKAEGLGDLLAQYHHFEAEFSQISYDAEGQLVEATNGRLWLSNPDRFRIESTEPSNQWLISDGEKLWNYDIDLEQVIISKLDKSNIPVLLLAKSQDEIEKAYETAYFDDEDARVYVLAPKDPDALFSTLNLTFSGKELRELMVLDGMGQSTLIVFSKIKVQREMGKDIFVLDIPEGVDVIQE